MDSPSLHTPLESRASRRADGVGENEEFLLIAGLGEPAAADFAAYACNAGHRNVVVIGDESASNLVTDPASARALADLSLKKLSTGAISGKGPALVLFLSSQFTARDQTAVTGILRFADEAHASFVGIVSTFRVHLDDTKTAKLEAHVLGLTNGSAARVVVFRPGHLLSPNSRASTWLRRFSFCAPLVPNRFRCCFVGNDELFAAIENERNHKLGSGVRELTLLGSNRSWREVLALHCGRGFLQRCLTVITTVVAYLGIGHFAGLIYTLLASRWSRLRSWNFDTLRPRDFGELLSLYNPYNFRHVKVVGYNNGVVHFGQRYPGKTIVSTLHCNRVLQSRPDLLKVDSGVTLRKALDFLADKGKELPVVPNYSYVTFGTSLFVPIHGSAAEFSTLADTITRALFYDPVGDRFIAAARNQAAFREYVYNAQAEVLLLRLYVRIAPKSRYYVHKEICQNPSSSQILEALQDRSATNVEIRKSQASNNELTISKYYKDPKETESTTLELPRDALGRLWDRLEENPIASFLLHALTRHLAWHVELFFTAPEFALFWESCRGLPLRKIQLRYIRSDGLPHSPFRDQDCVSVDLFMLRRHRHQFEAYLNETFRVVRYNPGKHSG